MQAGDRVRLAPRVARSMMVKRRHHVNWRKREGTIRRLRLHSPDAEVVWDGRTSAETWPVKALRCKDGPIAL
jgi:hypothetical protein